MTTENTQDSKQPTLPALASANGYASAYDHLVKARADLSREVANSLLQGNILCPEEEIKLCSAIKRLEDGVKRLCPKEA